MEHRSVAAGGEYHRVAGFGADRTGDQVTDHHAVTTGVVDDEVEHLVAGVQRHPARPDLPQEGL